MESRNQLQAVVIIDHGDEERGEMRVVGTARKAQEAMKFAQRTCDEMTGAIGFAAEKCRNQHATLNRGFANHGNEPQR